MILETCPIRFKAIEETSKQNAPAFGVICNVAVEHRQTFSSPLAILNSTKPKSGISTAAQLRSKMKTGAMILISAMLLFSCKDDFSIDQCVGSYVCEIYSGVVIQTPPDRLMPAFNNRVSHSVTTVFVTKSGNEQLTLKLNDETIIVQVDGKGNLTTSETQLYFEDENYNVSLTGTLVGAISKKKLFIEQQAAGTAIYDASGEALSMPASYMRIIDGTK